MFTLSILEVVIGLAFVYMILSLITTTLTELFASMLTLRSRNLYRGIKNLLNDVERLGLADEFYQHPLIRGISRNRRRWLNWLGVWKPSYIPSDTFALVMMDLIVNGGKDSTDDFRFLQNVHIIKNALKDSRFLTESPELRRQLELVVGTAESVAQAQASLEAWFNSAMERASGWYKRMTQTIIYIVALLVVIFVNGDSIMLFNRLLNDPAARSALVVAADRAVEEAVLTPDNGGDSVTGAAANPEATAEPSEAPLPDLEQTYNEILELYRQVNDGMQLIGWVIRPEEPTLPEEGASDEAQAAYQQALTSYERELILYENNLNRWPPEDSSAWFEKIIGLLLTTVAVSLGAPFWFDVLKRIANIRNTNPPEDTRTTETATLTITRVDDGGRG
ncbi:MAG: hypothetical protein OHK0046_41690 [Anaerolineae bacterium]